MLTERDFYLIERQATKLYAELEYEIIEEIAKRIASVGYANVVVYNNVKILEELGILYEDIIEMVAEYNEMSASQIREIFETAGIRSIRRDDMIYKLAGKEPLNLSYSMKQVLGATAENTSQKLARLTRTTAQHSEQLFLDAMNKTYMQVATGVKSYDQAINDAVKEISPKAAQVIYPTGVTRSIESAVRMNVLTSVNQMSGKLQIMRADEMEWDLMEISAHFDARPSHAEWQGEIVSLSGNPKYLSLEDIGYGTVDGFQGINCRHNWRPYYEGSSKTWDDEELEEFKNKQVTYNGKTMSGYDATQKQRYMERSIRQDKKELAGIRGQLSVNSNDELKNEYRAINNRLKQKNETLNDFLSQTGLDKDNSRLVI